MINKTEFASKFIKSLQNKQGVSKFSKKKAGEIMHHKHPDLYRNPEEARMYIRTVTGARGKRDIKIDHIVSWNGFQLPKPEKNDYSKVIVNEKRLGILSDIHFPYHDEKALNAAVAYLINFKPTCLILNGDTIDMYHASNFERNPENRDLKYEFDMLRNFLTQLVKLFPNTRIIYKAGNHDERYENRILQKVPEFINLGWMTLESAIHWNQLYKIEVVKNKRIIKAGHLNILHGHEFSKGFIAPVNVSRGFYLKAKTNVIAGHHHRISNHVETDINGKTVGAWSTGCLCEMNPKYMPINSWQHGFATVELNKEGEFKVNNIQIINGEIV